jgi:hypothetical protein
MTNRQLAIKIIRRLHKAGRQALLAGGCVRDMLLNRAAKDYDVATDAHPDEVVKLFRRTLRIGAKFGVVMVMEQDQKVEVATFRTESGYADGRHPDKLQVSNAFNAFGYKGLKQSSTPRCPADLLGYGITGAAMKCTVAVWSANVSVSTPSA